MKFLKKLFGCFRRRKLASAEQVHWINHTLDETVFWPNGGAMWANVHGFDEGPGQTYWVGVDVRSFGFRAADYIVKCKNKATYDDYLDCAINDTTKFLGKMKNDARMNCRNGSDVNIEYIFKWGGEEKTFDVHLGTDWLAEEK